MPPSRENLTDNSTTLERLTLIAKKHGGECLSENCINIKQLAHFRCEYGHEWVTKASNVLYGSWCLYCAGKKHDLQEMREIATSRGGECLSEYYLGMKNKHRWKCAHGHEWMTAPSGILHRGTWCPECSAGLGERLARVAIEHITGGKFPRSHPEWLVSPERTRLELDGFCEDLSIAFEHQGDQHYSPFSYYMSKEKYSRRIYLDEIKRKICSLRGILLIEVPQVGERVPLACLIDFYIKKLSDNNTFYPFPTNDVDYSPAYSTNGSVEYLERLRAIAIKKGGVCLENHYKGSSAKHRFMCAVGHEWESLADTIVQGGWCKKCHHASIADRSRMPIESIQAVALAKGGLMISNSYISNKQKLIWQCQYGHQWSASYISILKGRWCPTCSNRLPLSTQDYQKFALTLGGSLESEEIINSNTKVLWRCAKGHTWNATPSKVKRGSWCPFCAKTRPLSIEELQQIASDRGGTCLSTVYKSSSSKVEWCCARGHIWEAYPSQVKRGSWCPLCSKYRPLTLEELKQIALERGGACESTKVTPKIKWRCANEHTWEANPSDVKRGSWCPICSNNKPLSLEEIQQVALYRGGVLISTEIVNSKTKVEWQCSNGHTWQATPSKVKNGSWCPICSNHRPISIEDMRQIALDRGGICESTEIVNSKTKVKWRCANGHTWLATPSHIKRGTWCPMCSKQWPLSIEVLQQIASEKGGALVSHEIVNAKTKVKWCCKKGHTWETKPWVVKRGSWCPVCARNRRNNSDRKGRL
jgi:hypothetical protein